MANTELEKRVAYLEKTNEELSDHAERIAAILEITNLQSRYNLWLESGQYSSIWNELFAHNDTGVKCEIGESGIYEGPESVKRFWMALDGQERRRGYLAMTIPTTPCIVISKDGKTAKGMWHAFGPHTDYVTPDQRKLTAFWFSGKYDNEFIKEDGKWKFLSLHTLIYLQSPYEKGWIAEPNCAKWQVPAGAEPDKQSTRNELYHPDRKFYPTPPPPEKY